MGGFPAAIAANVYEEVLVAKIASGPACDSNSASTARFTSSFSDTASITSGAERTYSMRTVGAIRDSRYRSSEG